MESVFEKNYKINEPTKIELISIKLTMIVIIAHLMVRKYKKMRKINFKKSNLSIKFCLKRITSIMGFKLTDAKIILDEFSLNNWTGVNFQGLDCCYSK
jgi:hypothetical protein